MIKLPLSYLSWQAHEYTTNKYSLSLLMIILLSLITTVLF